MTRELGSISDQGRFSAFRAEVNKKSRQISPSAAITSGLKYMPVGTLGAEVGEDMNLREVQLSSRAVIPALLVCAAVAAVALALPINRDPAVRAEEAHEREPRDGAGERPRDRPPL